MRAFVIMPIQGERYGAQEDQRIFKEFDERFGAIERILDELDCVAIRIDKEAPLEGLVDRIRDEIRRSQFVITDLTDERPSCYYELGYADGLRIPAICIASQDSVLHPGTRTKIHFDVHRAVQFFSNHDELKAKIRHAFERNREMLLAPRDAVTTELAA
jgi:nucleoside 2-deoxyribosyltransferase